ncbi:methyl-accepting chemotaxis protein [Cohnella soli]|uniref:Methyl-accepting chemotaxis protein n=1 Tax=Cohnella soli TaxID=425005 RepID=A0ABW0I3S5_9BACL
MIIYNTTAVDHVDSQVAVYRNLTENKAKNMVEWVNQRVAELMLASGNETMRSNDTAAQLKYLAVLQELSASSSDMILFDKSGKAIVHSNSRQEVEQVEDKPYFKNALSGQPGVSDITVYRSGRSMISISVPVKDASDKQTIKVLTSTIPFEEMMDYFFKDMVIAKGDGYPIVMDDYGVIRYARQKEAIGVKPEQSTLPDGLKGILSQSEFKGDKADYTVDGETYIVTYAPVADTGFRVYLHMPLSGILGTQSKAENTFFMSLLISAVVTIVIALLIVFSITKPIGKIAKRVKRIAEGDLTGDREQIKNKDEIGGLADDLHAMTLSLRTMIGHLSGSASQVAATAERLDLSANHTRSASDQIVGIMEQVAAGSDSQLQGAHQSSQTMGELASGIQRVAESSSVVADAAAEAGKNALAGNHTLEQAIAQMNSISRSVNDSAERVRQLGGRSMEIEAIVSVMSGIAGQTNILALNAGIEAARAGEQGKGFAVVAGEVKKLAEQSRQSAEQINELIGEVRSSIEQVVDAMGRGVREVDKGIVAVRDAGEAFGLIVHSVQNVAEQMQDISAESEQMSAGAQQVTASMDEMVAISKASSDGVQTVTAASEEQLASVEQISSSAEQLSRMATELQNEVNRFKL